MKVSGRISHKQWAKVEMTILISDKGDFKIKNILDIK